MMSKRGEESKLGRFFSLTVTAMLVMSTLFVGITLYVPTAKAGNSLSHTVGNVDLHYLTDYGRMLEGITWKEPGAPPAHTAEDEMLGAGFIGLVIDHDGYNHTPGSLDIADCYTYPYFFNADFETVTAISWKINNGVTQKSLGSFKNSGTSQDANDILINQTAWTVLDKDWAIIQWSVSNIKATPINNFAIGLELPISIVGSLEPSGLGFDNGDDIDGYDAVNDTYWAQDDSGVTIGFGSAIASQPINHHYAADYFNTYTYDDYVNLYDDDTWLYNRLRAPDAVVGSTPGNRTATVGWNGDTIGVGSSMTYTLVIAINNSVAEVNTAIEDAQYYYYHVATGIRMTEISDSGLAAPQTPRIEVFNFGRPPVDVSTLSFSANVGALTGTWSTANIPTYGHAYFDVNENIGAEGDTITLYENGLPLEQFSFGQEGIVPDPLDGESVARRYDTASAQYSGDWVRNASAGPTWGAQNNVGSVILSPPVVLNRVMFNPLDPAEQYVELTWKGIPIDISGYRIVCDDEYTVPPGTVLNSANKFFVLPQRFFPPNFDMDDGTPNGDNVYLYHSNGNLLNSVGWSSAHMQGYYMSRIPDGNGTAHAYDDTTSQAAGWVFDNLPSLMVTEFYAEGGTATIELYNPRGGDKVFASGWSLESLVGGPLTGNWLPDPLKILTGSYSTFTMTAGTTGGEGDTISLYLNPGSGNILVDEVSFGTFGAAPDPLAGESTGRWWNSSIPGYSDDWTRNATGGPTWGAQNDVPALNLSSYIVLTEVMFNPSVDPDGKYVVITNREPGWIVPITNYYLVSDAAYQIPYVIGLGPGDRLIIRHGDDSPASDSFYTTMNDNTPVEGDNVYLYDPNGRLCDMVGWNTPHIQGMSVRRVPDGNGTNQGYDDISSEAAGWVFNTPLEVLMSEISDWQSAVSQIEVYNPWYPTINFSVGFTFENTFGTLAGTWSTPIADAGEHAVFDVDISTPLNSEGDTIDFLQNGILTESIGYGQMGTVPDPLPDESVQRYWDSTLLRYTDVWERNPVSNFGSQNNVPEANLTSQILLNEVLFYPTNPTDVYIEVMNKGATAIDISGYKIVCDDEYIVPNGVVLDLDERYFYFLKNMDFMDEFFPNMTSSGDNVYLYNKTGSLVDMVGWNSLHTQGGTMSRVPDGNGTRDGYDDVSSIAAGWRFDRTPTISLIRISTQNKQAPISYGHFGEWAIFNLTITNLQKIGDNLTFTNSSQEGWFAEVFDESGTVKVTIVAISPYGATVNITVNVTLPDSIPLEIMDNITFTIRSTNNALIGDSIILNPRVYPFLNLTKTADPHDIMLAGTGFPDTTQITLNMTAMGAQVAVRKYLDTVFCIDESGSMEQPGGTDTGRMRVLESQNFVANYFTPKDRGAVVGFANTARLIPDDWPIGDHLSMDYAKIISNLGQITSGGGTFIANGLNLSNEELRVYGQPADHLLNIILITDAQSSSIPDINQCYVEGQIAADRGVMIITIGLSITNGSNEEILLQDLAAMTGGLYYAAPNPSYFRSIYENISSYLADRAVWVDTTDPNPMVRDVLPPYIEYVPGSFSIPPDNIYVDPGTGETYLEWNLAYIKLGQSWSVNFSVRSNRPGIQDANVYDRSRAYYTRWDNTTTTVLFPRVEINVIPPVPYPPKLYINTSIDGNDIFLWWEEPLTPTVYYLIYREPTPTGFDFSAPWKNTLTDVDPGDPGGSPPPVGNRFSWNDTGAADPLDLTNYSDQYYYCIRGVNSLGETSFTSRTVGKWTKEYPAGNGTFSLPLEPFAIRDTEFYAQDMNARLIRWMNGTQQWAQHDRGEAGDNTNVEVGKGYEVDFASATKYTFLGMPGAQIRYSDLTSFVGFDYATEAASLTATADPISGNVVLNWTRPLGMDGDDQYMVYYSTRRDGFDGSEGTDYILMGLIPYGTETITDPGITWIEPEIYYMIIPVNGTGVAGASTYSIGVWAADYQLGYNTMAIPLRLDTYETADWYCDNVDDTVGINYFIYSSFARWSWHSTRMPAGAYDPVLIMTEAYQISTTAQTRFIFIGH